MSHIWGMVGRVCVDAEGGKGQQRRLRDLMKAIPEELVTKQPFNRPFIPYEHVKYPLPSDMSQIKLANPFFMVCFNLLNLQMGGRCH